MYSFHKHWWTILCGSHCANWQGWGSDKSSENVLWKSQKAHLHLAPASLWSTWKRPFTKIPPESSGGSLLFSKLAAQITGTLMGVCVWGVGGWMRWNPQSQTNPTDVAQWAALRNLAPLTSTLRHSPKPVSPEPPAWAHGHTSCLLAAYLSGTSHSCNWCCPSSRKVQAWPGSSATILRPGSHKFNSVLSAVDKHCASACCTALAPGPGE